MKVELRFAPYIGNDLRMTIDGPSKDVEAMVSAVRERVKRRNESKDWPFEEK